MACRTILLADRYASTNDMHKALKLQPLENRRTFHFGNLCHKNVFMDEVRTGLMSFFEKKGALNVRVSRRANTNDVIIPDVRSQIGRKSISYRGPSFWNSLPNVLKSLAKFTSFVAEWKRTCLINFENHPT